MPSFIKIYRSTRSKNKSRMIQNICTGCDFAYPTFARKIKKLQASDQHAFSKLEREWIAAHLKKTTKELFPKSN